MKNGLLIIISGPSGAGKGTIYHSVIEKNPQIKKSISVTTRPPRTGEIEGVHYYFKTLEEYQQMIANGDFLETASVYSNMYGTPKAPVYKMLEAGSDVMFEIDIIGAKQIKKKYPDSVTIYVMPPTFEMLEKRLRDRNTDSEESIKRRLSSAKSELAQSGFFEYIVFNDDLENSVQKVLSIIAAEKCKRARNTAEISQLLN